MDRRPRPGDPSAAPVPNGGRTAGPFCSSPQVAETTTLRGMTPTNQEAYRNLADDTRFRPLNEHHERFYYTDPETDEGRGRIVKKAELDKAAMLDADAGG